MINFVIDLFPKSLGASFGLLFIYHLKTSEQILSFSTEKAIKYAGIYIVMVAGFTVFSAVAYIFSDKPEKNTPTASGSTKPYTPPPAPSVPEDPEIVRARKLAEIELAKAEQMARLRLAEAQGLAGIASDVAEKEEARQDRQLDKLTKI